MQFDITTYIVNIIDSFKCNNYDTYLGKVCMGKNEGGVFNDVTLTQCQQKCDSDSECISFEYGHSNGKEPKIISNNKENFGKGELDGVAGAEAANNAVNGPTMVPLLTLGIPGDAVTALLLGAFMMQGLRPGPALLETNGEIVFAILIAMVIANFLFLVLGYISIPLFARVVTIKRSLLIPVTIMLAFSGTYLARSNPFDIVTLLGFGLVGIAARSAKFDVAPMVMGFILGRELEYTFGQTLALAGTDWVHFALTERIGMTVVVLATPIAGALLGVRMSRFRQRALKGGQA